MATGEFSAGESFMEEFSAGEFSSGELFGHRYINVDVLLVLGSWII